MIGILLGGLYCFYDYYVLFTGEKNMDINVHLDNLFYTLIPICNTYFYFSNNRKQKLDSEKEKTKSAKAKNENHEA